MNSNQQPATSALISQPFEDVVFRGTLYNLDYSVNYNVRVIKTNTGFKAYATSLNGEGIVETNSLFSMSESLQRLLKAVNI